MKILESFPNSKTTHFVSTDDSKVLSVLYPKVEGIRFNYVISAKSDEQHSDSLTTAVDRLILRHIRSVSDLIITTGKTARDENLNSSKFAPLLILTKSDEALSIPAVKVQSTQPVFVTQRLDVNYENPNAQSIGTLSSSITDFVTSFCQLNAYRRPVLEIGLSSAKKFASTNQITELDLTVTTAASENEATRHAEEFLNRLSRDFSKIQVLNFEDTWLFRFGL